MKMAPCRHLCSVRGQSEGQVHLTWETWGRGGKGDTRMWERLPRARPFSNSSGDKGVWGVILKCRASQQRVPSGEVAESNSCVWRATVSSMGD